MRADRQAHNTRVPLHKLPLLPQRFWPKPASTCNPGLTPFRCRVFSKLSVNRTAEKAGCPSDCPERNFSRLPPPRGARLARAVKTPVPGKQRNYLALTAIQVTSASLLRDFLVQGVFMYRWFITVLCSAPLLVAQSDYLRPVSWKQLPSNLLSDQKQIWTYPARAFTSRNIIPTLVFLGAAAALVTADPGEGKYFHTNNGFHSFTIRSV
jgi:hypothetical protein